MISRALTRATTTSMATTMPKSRRSGIGETAMAANPPARVRPEATKAQPMRGRAAEASSGVRPLARSSR
jgi:hypothetical protein